MYPPVQFHNDMCYTVAGEGDRRSGPLRTLAVRSSYTTNIRNVRAEFSVFSGPNHLIPRPRPCNGMRARLDRPSRGAHSSVIIRLPRRPIRRRNFAFPGWTMHLYGPNASAGPAGAVKRGRLIKSVLGGGDGLNKVTILVFLSNFMII